MTIAPPQTPPGLEALLDLYDVFIFDLWGVLYDGKQCFPGITPMLRKIKMAGKKIGILSNSPRPLAAAAENIRKYNLVPEYYDALLTSGQLVFEALRTRSDPWLQKLGKDCIHIGPDREFAPYLPLGLTREGDLDNATFIFATGISDALATREDFRPILDYGLERKLPLLCANPDRFVMRGDQRSIAIGTLAAQYAELGGDVRDNYGKPHPEIFRRMLQQLGAPPERTLMIGDNLLTDITGARALHIPTLWIYGGVHLPELGPEAAHDLATCGKLTTEELVAFLEQQDCPVNYAMPRVVF
ncbi:MAG: TIGR01459 family HAD-type hydrolase [Alphaproteobacteria bacterium]